MEISLEIIQSKNKAVWEWIYLKKGKSFGKKTGHFFIQMFLTSLSFLFHINFVLFHDSPFGRIL